MPLFKVVIFLTINLIWSSCSTSTTNVNMKDTTSKDELKDVSKKETKIIKIQSSLPTPTSGTMAMFSLAEENGSYELPNGEVKKGQTVRIYSTDSDDLPEHLVGVGSEFVMVGYKYRVVKIALSEDYTKARDEAWVEELGAVTE